MYFPKLYPFETDYSYISRLFLYSGYYGQRTFMKDCCKRRTPSVRFITPLNENIRKYDMRTIDRAYIERHTLYSKYEPFIERKNRSEVLQKMLHGSPDADSSAKIPALDKYFMELCYCPKCAEYQRRQYGEAIWDARVQCTHICPKHGATVITTGISMATSHNLILITAEEVIP